MILPNQLTILRIILSPVFLFLFLSDEIILKQISIVVFIAAALTDWYDGWLARKFNYITSWGKFWDPLADKILTSIAFIGTAIVNLIPFWMVILIVGRDIIITLLRVISDRKGFQFATSNYAKIKTMLQMIFLYYLLIVYVASLSTQISLSYVEIISVLLNKDLLFYLALFITIITIHSGILYILKNAQLLKKIFKSEA